MFGAGQNTCLALPLVHTSVPQKSPGGKKTKSKFPHATPLRPTLNFLFLSLPLLHRARRLLSGCNQSLFCARCNLIGPLFSLRKYPRGRFRFCTKSGARTRGSQKALISSHHCRAMTNVPLLICDKWWKAVGLSCETRWTLRTCCCHERSVT